MSHSSLAVSSAVCAVVFGLAVSTGARTNENPAHALAEKFAAASKEKANNDEAQRKADEADLLKRARKEAQDLRRANEQSLAAAKKKEAARRAAAEKQAAEERARIAQSEADRKRLDAKIKALDEAARAEKERLAQAEKDRLAQAEKARLAKARAVRAAAAEKARIAKREKERAAKQVALDALTAERERTAKELEAKLRKIAAARKANANTEPPFDRPPMALGAPAKAPSADKPSNDTHLADAPAAKPRSKPAATGNRLTKTDRVTILVEMVESGLTPSVPNRKKPDPVLCSDVFCWISNGSDRIARKTTRRAALGPINTISRRAAACNRSLTCIYRGVQLTDNKLTLQAIDIGVLGHERGQIIEVAPDFTCDSDYGSLKCNVTYNGDIWRAWIVPEAVAKKAGPNALRRALREGLTSMREASLQ